MRLRTVASILVAGLAACSSGGSLPSEPSLREPPRAALNVPLRVFIPAHVPRGRQARGLLHQHFIATNSAGIAMAVYPHGLRLHQVASFTGNISSSSPACKIVTGGRACSFALSLPPGGPYDFVLKTYDEPPAGRVIPGGAHQLGAAVDTAKIAIGKSNGLRFTVGGVVARTFIHMARPELFHAIASRTLRVSIGALDADGNLIASDTYVDANGNTVTITPTADSKAGSTIAFLPAKFSAPQPNGVTMQYSAPAATAAQLQFGFDSVITASTGSNVTSGSLIVVVFYPGVPIFFNTHAGPYDVAVESGTWVVSSANTNNVDTVFNDTLSGNALPAAANAYGTAVDTTGEVWFAEGPADVLGNAAYNGYEVDVAPSAVTLSAGTTPVGVTNGPDGAIWFTAQGANAIGRVNRVGSPTVTTYPLPTHSAGAYWITGGPDGALWFTECSAGKIGRVPVNAVPGSSAQIKEFPIPLKGGAFPLGIVAGTDGALWFTDNSSAYIGRITTSGSITRYPIPSGRAAGLIAVGPDGAMWFTEPSGDKIGRILTSATTAHPGIVEFATNDSGSSPFGITVDSDGIVYYTEYAADKVVEFQ